ncbi:MAG: hypothetical protein OEY38_23320, partial [Gammaproteobacteria bacterium]|nr:hypothetical protein [Gammaproteobacteria bacterium]
MQNNNSTFNNSNNRRLTAHFIKILIFFSFSLLFNACGGGDSDDTDDTPSDVKTGVFVDSPVAGLRYQSQDIGGTTNAKGEFKYREGQKVQFFIGDLGIGEAEGAAQITPLDLFADAANVTDQRVKNLAALLQTLDENQDASDGIVLNAEVQAAIQATTAEEIIQIDFDQQTNDLTNIAEVKRLLMAANSSTTQARPLKNTDAALVHLQGSIGNTQSELFSISINVTGLNTGDGELRFSNFAQDQLVFGESGLLSFSTQLPATAHYSISIDEPMPAQKSCSLIEGESFSGVISNDVTIQVLCQAKKTAVTIDFSDDTLSLLPANFSMQFKDNQSNSFLDLNPSDDGQVVQLIEPAFLNNLQLIALKDGSGETIIGKICNSSYASETLTIVCSNKKYSVGGTISGVGGNFTLAYRRNSSVGDPIVVNFSLDDVDDTGLFAINNVFEHGDDFVIESFATEVSNKQCSFEFDEDAQADELPYSGTINDADALELSITCVTVHAVSVNIRGLSVSRPYAQELIIGVSDDTQNQYENINAAFNTSDGTPLNLKQAASNDNQLIIEGTNLIFSLNQPTGRRCSFVANGEISVLPETLVSEQNVNNFTGQVQYVLCAR